MKEFKGTTLKWFYDENNGKGMVNYASISGYDTLCAVDGWQKSDKEVEANCKLIAAAPILLKELQKVRLDIKLSGAFKEDSPIVKGIDEAINKALD